MNEHFYVIVAENMPYVLAQIFTFHNYDCEFDAFDITKEFKTPFQLIEFGMSIQKNELMYHILTKEQYDQIKDHISI